MIIIHSKLTCFIVNIKFECSSIKRWIIFFIHLKVWSCLWIMFKLPYLPIIKSTLELEYSSWLSLCDWLWTSLQQSHEWSFLPVFSIVRIIEISLTMMYMVMNQASSSTSQSWGLLPFVVHLLLLNVFTIQTPVPFLKVNQDIPSWWYSSWKVYYVASLTPNTCP